MCPAVDLEIRTFPSVVPSSPVIKTLAPSIAVWNLCARHGKPYGILFLYKTQALILQLISWYHLPPLGSKDHVTHSDSSPPFPLICWSWNEALLRHHLPVWIPLVGKRRSRQLYLLLVPRLCWRCGQVTPTSGYMVQLVKVFEHGGRNTDTTPDIVG